MNPFYNHEQKRIRALWRILIQGGLFLVGLTLISTVLGVIAMLIMSASGQADLDLLLNQDALMDVMMSLGGGLVFCPEWGRYGGGHFSDLFAGWLATGPAQVCGFWISLFSPVVAGSGLRAGVRRDSNATDLRN